MPKISSIISPFMQYNQNFTQCLKILLLNQFLIFKCFLVLSGLFIIRFRYGSFSENVQVLRTAQKIHFSIIKFHKNQCPADLVTLVEEILNRKLQFLCGDIKQIPEGSGKIF